ncbi:hypothetical protein [Thiobacillus denitrificans]|uniref:hypothetical protein n=1 Tax=Thiobacillus denitrificans TaxID=36861 RepID=UPI0012F7E037|nr:hypothetical protein [Thiobacillus denitrificans]
MNKLIPTLLAALILPMASMNVYAEKACNRGDTRCAADGYVQECIGAGDFTSWSPSLMGKRCANPVAGCTEGDKKCGVDGFIMRCTYENRWESTVTACKK